MNIQKSIFIFLLAVIVILLLNCEKSNPLHDDSKGDVSITDISEIVWVAPGADGTYILSCTISDGIDSTFNSIQIIVGSPVNTAPLISSLVVNPIEIDPDGTTTLSCYADDDNGDLLSYEWTATGGTFLTNNTDEVSWQAPSLKGTYLVTCTVSDGLDSAIWSENIVVGSPSNNAPVVESFVSVSYEVKPGSTIMVTCTAIDEDGDSLKFSWRTSEGSFSESKFDFIGSCESCHTNRELLKVLAPETEAHKAPGGG